MHPAAGDDATAWDQWVRGAAAWVFAQIGVDETSEVPLPAAAAIAGVLEVTGKQLPPASCLRGVAEQALARVVEPCNGTTAHSAVARVQMHTLMDGTTSTASSETATIFSFGIVPRNELVTPMLKAQLHVEIQSNGCNRLLPELVLILKKEAPSCQLVHIRLDQQSGCPRSTLDEDGSKSMPEQVTLLPHQAVHAPQTIPRLSMTLLPDQAVRAPQTIPRLSRACSSVSPTARNLAANPKLRKRVLAGAIPRTPLIAHAAHASTESGGDASDSPTARNLAEDPGLRARVLAGKMPRIESFEPGSWNVASESDMVMQL
eukprot:gnl/TRDRNA2_/TRDRNA2_191973_c0_seq1.p1 gnl/TRDRNA2_/TRDRNA2_191973_c0~~gnl/TRDRNA2_/TRDRNA2_191973_c0_seq1.p1  ORF type:complete len:334 (+),score=45.36 gnl/TRDRNA2_/TRDRNA2_191973_c0_seq1:54-1004(+)